MDLKELLKAAYSASFIYGSFDDWYSKEGEQMVSDHKVKLIRSKMEEIQNYIESIDRVMKSISELKGKNQRFY